MHVACRVWTGCRWQLQLRPDSAGATGGQPPSPSMASCTCSGWLAAYVSALASQEAAEQASVQTTMAVSPAACTRQGM
ncbi:hypothetical protein E2562_029565 [Oryza meyeriana var. granulata]|uniref:Uncharacterized protein n=1 Tax=Oryza meyeriana var. granulata TaxID=110450 RepID=A0A6G1C884_9ORYZ|nr:hypothetical protein E2562_029565 [Oryza meyeriana var. granulata]